MAVGGAGDKSFTVQNIGTADLIVSDPSLVGPDADQLAIVGGGGAFTLARGQSRAVIVRFAPTSTGTNSANFVIYSNDTDENPVTVFLSGTGCSYELNSTGVVFGYKGGKKKVKVRASVGQCSAPDVESQQGWITASVVSFRNNKGGCKGNGQCGLTFHWPNQDLFFSGGR